MILTAVKGMKYQRDTSAAPFSVGLASISTIQGDGLKSSPPQHNRVQSRFS